MKILIADDSSTNLKLLRAILEAEGHNVIEAADGQAAMRILEHNRVDAIISDILMPYMDGYRFCSEVRRRDDLRHLPFIIYTATYTSPADEKLSLDLGADRYLRKPVPTRELIAVLNEVILSPRRPVSDALAIPDVLKEYSQQLVMKLEEKNEDLRLSTEETRKAHTHLQHLLAHSPAVTYTLKVKGGHVTTMVISENIERLLGVSPANATFGWWTGSLHPDDREMAVAALEAAIDGGGFSIEYRIMHAMGHYVWIADSNRVVHDPDGEHTEIIGVMLDIGERKKLEAELNIRDQRLSAFFSSAAVGLALIGRDLRFIQVNKATADLLGLPADEIIGKTIPMVAPDLAERSIPQIHRVLTEGVASPIIEVSGEFPGTPGVRRHWMRSFFPIVDSSGKTDSVGAVTVDITDRKRAEDQLAATLAELEERVEERTADLAKANVELQAAKEFADSANVAKSEFLSRMSHELRTPMNAILGFGQLLEMSELDDKQSDRLDHILKAGRHLLGLINDVLEISRIEIGSLGISLEPISVTEVLEESISLMRPSAAEKKISITLTKPGTLYVTADRQRLRQIVLNLLSNAIKYNAEGGTVSIRAETGPDDTVGIQVSDTGIGIPKAVQERLFTPFDRLGVEMKGIEGTGLGLSLSKSLAVAMKGNLTFESKEGKGSVFKISLNRCDAPADSLRHDFKKVPKALCTERTKCKVLAIEDNFTNTELLAQIFEDRPDIELITAMHGRLGLELAAEHLPSVVLLDLHLPDMDGREIMLELRKHPELKAVPVIIVSADAFLSQAEALLNAGAFRYLSKPFVISDLIEAVDAALEVAPKRE